MALRAMVSKSSFALVVISPPITTTFDFTKVSHATRLCLSVARHASSTASEIVSATLSGWPSPTDSEEKMYLSITLHKKAREVAGCARLRQICRACPARAVHQVVEITAQTTHKYRSRPQAVSNHGPRASSRHSTTFHHSISLLANLGTKDFSRIHDAVRIQRVFEGPHHGHGVLAVLVDQIRLLA